MKTDADYERGAQLTYELVRAWTSGIGAALSFAEEPRFAFPPKGIALIGDLRDIGKQLARNDSARKLVEHLVEFVVDETGRAPTAMMLLVVLEALDIPVEHVSLTDLGLKVGTS